MDLREFNSMKYAVLSFTNPNEKMKKVIRKAGSILGEKFTVSTTPDSEMNMLFYEANKGGKELYSEQPTPEVGFPIFVNPTFGNLRKLAMKEVKGFINMKPHHRSLVYSTLACLYGLEGKEGNNPHLTTKFVITEMNPEHPRHEDHKYCALLAKQLGFRVINLANSEGRRSLMSILRKLSAK